MTKGCALSTGYLPREGLPRNSVDRITDRPDMTSAVDRGRKASTQTNKQKTKESYDYNRCHDIDIKVTNRSFILLAKKHAPIQLINETFVN